MIKNIITSAITSVIVALVVVGLVGGHQPVSSTVGSNGNITNYDNLTLNPSTGTSTLSLAPLQAGVPGCIQLISRGGTTTRVYLGASSTVLTLENGTCNP